MCWFFFYSDYNAISVFHNTASVRQYLHSLSKNSWEKWENDALILNSIKWIFSVYLGAMEKDLMTRNLNEAGSFAYKYWLIHLFIYLVINSLKKFFYWGVKEWNIRWWAKNQFPSATHIWYIWMSQTQNIFGFCSTMSVESTNPNLK